MEKESLIQKLINARNLGTGEEYQAFESAMEKLGEDLRVEDIDSICRAFYDDTQDEEVMFGLIHLIEQLPGEGYLKKIALCTPEMKDGREWALTLNRRILNSPQDLEMYADVIKSLTEAQRQRLFVLFEDIKNDNPDRFMEKVEYIYKKIGR